MIALQMTIIVVLMYNTLQITCTFAYFSWMAKATMAQLCCASKVKLSNMT